MSTQGMCAAGHPLSAEAGARALRAGGNAVDAAVAAMLTSWVAEPLLTGPGAGGYLLVAGPDQEPTLLDFFVAAPGFGCTTERSELTPVDVDFGDAVQVFNVGASSCGVPGNPAGVAEAARRWGTMPLEELAAPAAALAREGVPMNHAQAFIAEILAGILVTTPEARSIFAPEGHVLREGDVFCSPELGDAIERLGREGAAPFYTGELAERIVAWVAEHGGTLTAEDLRRYAPVEREPVHVTYRGRDVMTNPPPNAGGVLLALALAHLDASGDGPPALADVVDAMVAAQAERTPEFTTGLADEAYARRFVSSRLGSTTHISVLDGDGCAATVTCTNGEGSGLVVPGTGIHVNNIMGEEDLNPLGFHRAEPGTRMPSMMAPTVVLRDGGVELVLGSAGSNRIRSAILQTIVGVVDHGMAAPEAVEAPRLHVEGGIVYTEPGVPVEELSGDHKIIRFRDRNVFFGGAQAIEQDLATGHKTGAGDPRRGGVAVEA